MIGSQGITRRALMAGTACAAACRFGPAAAQPAVTRRDDPAIRTLLARDITIDMHSHAGRFIRASGGFEPVAGPMRAGGMNVVALAMVADAPVTRVLPDGRIVPVRAPRSGELAAAGREMFDRILRLADAASLVIIRDRTGLVTARQRSSVIVAAEGADFLEGSLERLDEAIVRYSLRHLQLTHFRINELGDSQTEAPVHNGLTAFGAEVVRACNEKGIIVDVAHSSFAATKRAAAVTSKPIVLSHSSLTPAPRQGSRLITRDHARAIADTGGVVGLWPPLFAFRDMAQYAQGFARMVEAIGIDHVGLGTDMLGLPGGSVLPGYEALPDLAAALLAAGFQAPEIGKILGGNYARVFAAVVG